MGFPDTSVPGRDPSCYRRSWAGGTDLDRILSRRWLAGSSGPAGWWLRQGSPTAWPIRRPGLQPGDRGGFGVAAVFQLACRRIQPGWTGVSTSACDVGLTTSTRLESERITASKE